MEMGNKDILATVKQLAGLVGYIKQQQYFATDDNTSFIESCELLIGFLSIDMQCQLEAAQSPYIHALDKQRYRVIKRNRDLIHTWLSYISDSLSTSSTRQNNDENTIAELLEEIREYMNSGLPIAYVQPLLHNPLATAQLALLHTAE